MAGETNIFVIDSSFVLGFLLPDENNQLVIDTFAKYSSQELKFIAPTLLPFEVVNGLKNAYLSNRITEETAFKLTKDFLSYNILLKEIDLSEVFKVSWDKNLSVYDAAYLHLTQIEHIPLLTLDVKLKRKS